MDRLPKDAILALQRRALDPNVFHDAALMRAAAALVGVVDFVSIGSGEHLLGAMPVFRQAPGLGLVGTLPHVLAHHMGPLGTPALDPDLDIAGVADLIRAAAHDAAALVIPFIDLDSQTAHKLLAAASRLGAETFVARRHHRAALDATERAEAFLASLSSGRRKEWRRQERRLAETGTIVHDTATTPERIEIACADVLTLEARGWKGRRATALLNDQAGLDFARTGIECLAARGQVRIDRLIVGERTVAGLITLLAHGRAFIWKTAYDEDFARSSPGVLLMLKVTEDFLADPAIFHGDSLAVPGHPMIEPIWPQRIEMGTLVIMLTKSPTLQRMIRADIALYDQARSTLKRLLRRR